MNEAFDAPRSSNPSNQAQAREDGGVSRNAAVKKACNECRQQKLRCNGVRDPFTPCARCTRLQMDCRFDVNFKRVEKRKERHQKDQQNPAAKSPTSITMNDEPSSSGGYPAAAQGNAGSIGPNVEFGSAAPEGQYSETQNFSWADTIQSGIPSSSGMFQPTEGRIDKPASNFSSTRRQLDGIDISGEVAQHLFEQYFTHYHPFLPFLTPQDSPDTYYHASHLLYWVIIGVASRRFSSDLTLLPSLSISVPRLMWSTLQSVSQNYHNCKALCILCAWPFPKSDSSNDPTFLLAGTMMHLAIQAGLHMPDYAQDFSKGRLNLRREDLNDRYVTWNTCNIVAQSVATGLGLPSSTKYNWSLDSKLTTVSYRTLPQPLASRLRIEMFCDRVSKALYDRGSFGHDTKSISENFGKFQLLTLELQQLESDLNFEMASTQTLVYLRCAQIHLQLYALFDLSGTSRLLLLYQTCCQFLTQIISLEVNPVLNYCPFYVFQVVLASGFILMRLLRSSFAQYVDADAGRSLFNSTISACRQISISNNDLPGRLADVLAQLWAWGNRPTQDLSPASHGSFNSGTEYLGSSLVVRSRMSMSVVYDSLWMWRKVCRNDPSTRSAPTNPTLGNGHKSSLEEMMEDEVNAADLDQTEIDALFSLDWVMDGAMTFPDPGSRMV